MVRITILDPFHQRFICNFWLDVEKARTKYFLDSVPRFYVCLKLPGNNVLCVKTTPRPYHELNMLDAFFDIEKAYTRK